MATRIITYSFFTIILCVFEVCTVHGQSSSDRGIVVIGKVTVVEDSIGLFFPPPNEIPGHPQVLPGALIKVMDTDSTIVGGTNASQTDGSFHVEGLSPGKYIIEAFYVGYEKTTRTIELTDGKKHRVDLVLGRVYDPSELPYGASDAEKDIRNGIIELRKLDTIKIIEYEEQWKKYEARMKHLQETYGYTFRNIQDDYDEVSPVQWEKLRQANIRYNAVVIRYLNSKYGDAWKCCRY